MNQNASSSRRDPHEDAASAAGPEINPAGAIVFSPPTFSPLYQQIKLLIMQRLQSGEWRSGEMIPSEIELGNRFGVSQGTVRKAIDALAKDNLLVRRQGRGTFVATHLEAESQYRFLRLKPDEPHRQRSARRIVDFRRQRATADMARALALKPGDSVVAVRRLLMFDARPVICEDIWLPGVIFRALTAERMERYAGPTYALYESEFATRMIRASEQIRAVVAEGEVADLLEVTGGSPLLQVERVAYTYGDRPVELRRGLYSTARHHYQNELN